MTLRTWLWISLATAAALPVSAVEGDFKWNGRIGPGQTIEIRGVNGGIHAEFSNGTEAQVTGHKTASKSDLNSVRVEAVPHSGGITICTVYTDGRSTPNECKPGTDGRVETRNNDVRVEYTIRIPKGVRLVAKTVNGEVTGTGLQSDLVARTVNGKVHVATSGTASAETVNGGIEASIGAATWSAPLDFKTVNGGVEVTIPSSTNANVAASTVNGSITTDFPLTVSGKWGPKSLNGRIGNGGRDLKLTTVNGGIRLKSSSI